MTEYSRWKAGPEGQKDQPIYGLIPFEQLTIFKDDPDGLPRLDQYIDKLLQNLFTFSSELNRRKRQAEVIKKITQRRKLQERIRKHMPQYSEVLKQWEVKTMTEKNITQEQIKKLKGT